MHVQAIPVEQVVIQLGKHGLGQVEGIVYHKEDVPVALDIGGLRVGPLVVPLGGADDPLEGREFRHGGPGLAGEAVP